MQYGSGSLEDILPFKSLRHVKELELDTFPEHFYVQPSWQQWPMAWSRLTALTSLTCMLEHRDTPHVPAVLNRMTSLRSLQIWQTFTDSHVPEANVYRSVELKQKYSAAEQRILETTKHLTRLTILKIGKQLFF